MSAARIRLLLSLDKCTLTVLWIGLLKGEHCVTVVDGLLPVWLRNLNIRWECIQFEFLLYWPSCVYAWDLDQLYTNWRVNSMWLFLNVVGVLTEDECIPKACFGLTLSLNWWRMFSGGQSFVILVRCPNCRWWNTRRWSLRPCVVSQVSPTVIRVTDRYIFFVTGLRTYKRPDGKSGGHGVGWSPMSPYSFKVPQDWEEVSSMSGHRRSLYRMVPVILHHDF